ncbi:oligopeptide ABC transporter permease [Isobaculum melis]|uniref:Peptide/nickel transport system permease protein n=1 Tax=Isobaculum melis TaxID=142588 RepID=A0A1H9RAR7_9LACT|nr:oligopeptide ABC transporter permease [Isobaculum melis]SER70021.1 peptide/nickel transport system permease protein [Isobaculum melis]
MWKTVLRRVLFMIPQLFILSILIFALAKLMPGDPFTGLITPDTDPKTIEALREAAGLNDSILVQYGRWITNAFKGDFGVSYTHKIAVSSIIGQRAGNTVFLSLFTIIMTYVIALPVGLLAGRYQNSIFDKIVVIYNYISYAVPTFVLGLVILFLFGYQLQWFPTSGSVDVGVTSGTFAYFMNKLYHLILPGLTGAILGTATTIQYLRNEVIDAKQQDFVKTARSKGVPVSKVYSRHIFRNSMLPITSNIGMELVALISGSIFIETIFAYPGIGQLFIQSIGSRDYSVITALVMLFGVITLIGTLVSDILMSVVDPRIRLD